MFPRNAQLDKESETSSASSLAIQSLQQLNTTDKATLITLASYARMGDPDVMCVLVDKLIGMLENAHNKWVFAAIGAACCASTLSDARHFTEENTSLPVKLFSATMDAMKELHKGYGQPDVETIRLGLLALTATLEILIANDIKALDESIYNDAKKLLNKFQTTKYFSETVSFLSENALLALKSIGKQDSNTSIKGTKGQLAEGGIDFLLGTALMGAGVTGFAVSIGATAATGGILAPVVVAGAFSFFTSAGFATERYYNSLKKLKKIIENEQQKGRFKDLPLGFLTNKVENQEPLVRQMESTQWEQVIVSLITNTKKSLNPFETKQLIFTLARLLETDGLTASYKNGLSGILKTLYSDYVDSKSRTKTAIRKFLLEQIQGLSVHHELLKTVAGLKQNISTVIATQPKKEKAIIQLKEEFVAYCGNTEKTRVVCGAIDFKHIEPLSRSAQIIDITEGMNELKLEQAGLASQRLIKNIQRQGQENISECIVIPAAPDGNCGFSAIAACLRVLKPGHLSPESIESINRDAFTETVHTQYLDESCPEARKLLIENMFREDGASSLEEWSKTFKQSGIYVGESHLKVLSHLYDLAFHVYVVSEKERTNHFEPETSYETITGFDDNEKQPLTSIHLAHITAGLREEQSPQNHFEGLIIEPTEAQKERINKLTKENSLLKKANQDLSPFIQGRALLHPHAVKHADRYTGSSVNNFKALVENPHGFVDKSEFLLAVFAHSGNKAILRPRRSGKSMLFSMADRFFSVLHKEKSHTLFSDLNVATRYPNFYKYHRGRYPTLLLDLKDITGRTYKDVVERFKLKIVEKSYGEYVEILLESPRISIHEKKKIERFAYNPLELSDAEAIGAIEKLIEWLCRHYGEKVIVLVDEYDSPLIKALQGDEPYYEDLKKFITNFFSTTFKTNDSLMTAVFTGIMNAKGTGIFSELNNISTYTYLEDSHFGPYAGFTPDEIEQYLVINKLGQSSELIQTMRAFYNGYICLKRTPNPDDGGLDIASYLSNTHSISQCVMERGIVTSYWVKSSSSHQLIVDVINRADSTEIEQQILELTGSYLHHVLCQERPPIEPDMRRGIYLYMDDGQLTALVVHNDYLFEPVELDDMPTGNFNFPNEGEKIVQLKESDVKYILSKCSHKSAQENFAIYTPLTLTNLDFLVKTHKNTAEDIYCLLFYSGYLTFTGRRKEIEGNIHYELKIPNQEIKLMFKREIVPKIKAQQEMRHSNKHRLPANYQVKRLAYNPYGFHAQPQQARDHKIENDSAEQPWSANCPEGFTAFEQDGLYVIKIPDVDADVFENEAIYDSAQEILKGKRGLGSRMYIKSDKMTTKSDILTVYFEQSSAARRLLYELSNVIDQTKAEEKNLKI